MIEGTFSIVCMICGAPMALRDDGSWVCTGTCEHPHVEYTATAPHYSLYAEALSMMTSPISWTPPTVTEGRDLTPWEWIKVNWFNRPDPRDRWPDTIKVALDASPHPYDQE